MDKPVPRTRIQKKNIARISEAALSVFSTYGFRGSTVDQIAKQAKLSKPNLLYYFPSKEAIHTHLLSTLMDTWLDPLRALDDNGDPLEEILTYMRRKLQMSRDHPRESRLFANEIVQGAPRILTLLETDLKQLVDQKAAVIAGWMDQGRIARADPHHLIFSIWSLTQHYADFDVQVHAVLGPEKPDPYPEAEAYLVTLFTRMLTP
ncbi:TetR family transcriptional regulator C-terminal domain-containing protein [Pseudooceanicola sp. CBS1P-1]|uniref:TetR family transcriptional regulator n=1 Tax=Pseudooceanicola albus TaxID=2692189 RepID=A0A6L7G7K7_9RHOB|nr:MULTISPECIES: TetR family transcriptional regulator C-terminal domain-containing protein [Pseudooceanicola]MBT9383112.1 TetR family transcriptional regulator C-terminal domain-containing protein [Pseudooceanicola endophyticus]MXN19300.1 TetR family transcriptional regulator [Pseudooceanicola albus]